MAVYLSKMATMVVSSLHVVNVNLPARRLIITLKKFKVRFALPNIN